MDAETAKQLAQSARDAKQREMEAERERERERQARWLEQERTTGVDCFLTNAYELITGAAKAGESSVQVNANSRLIAQLGMEKLQAAGFGVIFKEEFVPEDREYGSSGEGMHDSYWTYTVTVRWT